MKKRPFSALLIPLLAACVGLFSTGVTQASEQRALACQALLNSKDANQNYVYYLSSFALLPSPSEFRSEIAVPAITKLYRSEFKNSASPLASAYDYQGFLKAEIESLKRLRAKSWTALASHWTWGTIQSSSTHCIEILEALVTQNAGLAQIALRRAQNASRVNSLRDFLIFVEAELQAIGHLGDDAHDTDYQNSRSLATLAELFKIEGFRPAHFISLQNFKFFITPVHLSAGRRDFALLYTLTPQGRILPRLLWRSQSNGDWRTTPYVFQNTFNKGNGHHYTQETKLVREIAALLEGIPSQGEPNDLLFDRIKSYFELMNQYQLGWITFDRESVRAQDQGAFAPFQSCRPGECFETEELRMPHANYCSYLQALSRSLPQGSDPKTRRLFPDLKSPVRSYRSQHQLLALGHPEGVAVHVFKTELASREVSWHFANVKEHTWIDRIEFEDGPITSYGTRAEVIDSGVLTNKPVEYTNQSLGLAEDEFRELTHGYRDITPLLKCLEPISEFDRVFNRRFFDRVEPTGACTTGDPAGNGWVRSPTF